MSVTDSTLQRIATLVETRRTVVVSVLGLALLVWPFLLDSSLLFSITLIFVFALLAFAAIVPIGYAGQLILSQGAFFGIGAYSFVKLTAGGVPGFAAVPVAVVLTAGVAYALGWPATRASGIYLGIITLAFNELFVISLNIFSEFTGGSTGIASASLFPAALTDLLAAEILYYYLIVAVFALVYLWFRRILGSEMGWAFLSVKEDRTVAESVGIDSHRYRLISFTIAGATCGLAGSLYAPLTGYISPTEFGLQTSIDIILAGMLGGLTVPIGGVLGSSVVVIVPDFLRVLSDVRLILFGSLLIVILVYLPRGIGGWIQDRLEDGPQPGDD